MIILHVDYLLLLLSEALGVSAENWFVYKYKQYDL